MSTYTPNTTHYNPNNHDMTITSHYRPDTTIRPQRTQELQNGESQESHSSVRLSLTHRNLTKMKTISIARWPTVSAFVYLPYVACRRREFRSQFVNEILSCSCLGRESHTEAFASEKTDLYRDTSGSRQKRGKDGCVDALGWVWFD